MARDRDSVGGGQSRGQPATAATSPSIGAPRKRKPADTRKTPKPSNASPPAFQPLFEQLAHRHIAPDWVQSVQGSRFQMLDVRPCGQAVLASQRPSIPHAQQMGVWRRDR
jgi:hypothetical protein